MKQVVLDDTAADSDQVHVPQAPVGEFPNDFLGIVHRFVGLSGLDQGRLALKQWLQTLLVETEHVYVHMHRAGSQVFAPHPPAAEKTLSRV